jgi:hypothetical protein
MVLRKLGFRGRTLLDAALFSIAPVLFLIVGFFWTKGQGPQWLGRNFENSYPYLLNSLAIVEGKSPFWVDHPGTTTQIFGAAVLRTSALGSSRHYLVNAVLADPEGYVSIVHRAELVFSCLLLWILPWWAGISAGARLIGLLIQVPVFFFIGIVNYIGWFGSDLLLVPVSIAAISIGAVLIQQKRYGRRNLATVAMMGIACGLGIATKLTFFPIILLALLLCHGFRNWITFAGSFLITCAVTFIPIYPRLIKVFNWIVALSSHSGYYGRGPVGLPTADRYLLDILQLVQAEPCLWMIPIAAAVAITLCVIRVFSTAKDLYAQSLLISTAAVLVIQAVSFLIIAKHPGIHYLFALEMSLGLDLLLLFEVFRTTENLRPIRIIGGLTLIALLFAGFWHGAKTLPLVYRSLRVEVKKDLNFYRLAKRRAGDTIIVGYYRSLSPEFALWFANDFSEGIFGKYLQKLYPKALVYNIFNSRFQTFTESFDSAAMERRYEHLFLLGNRPIRTASNSWTGYFDKPITQLVASQDGYSLEEWRRPSVGSPND